MGRGIGMGKGSAAAAAVVAANSAMPPPPKSAANATPAGLAASLGASGGTGAYSATFRGVYLRCGRWNAQIQYGGRKVRRRDRETDTAVGSVSGQLG